VVARSVVADAKGGYAIEEVEISPPGPREVLVKVRPSSFFPFYDLLIYTY